MREESDERSEARNSTICFKFTIEYVEYLYIPKVKGWDLCTTINYSRNVCIKIIKNRIAHQVTTRNRKNKILF